jgi:hypothetical protein
MSSLSFGIKTTLKRLQNERRKEEGRKEGTFHRTRSACRHSSRKLILDLEEVLNFGSECHEFEGVEGQGNIGQQNCLFIDLSHFKILENNFLRFGNEAVSLWKVFHQNGRNSKYLKFSIHDYLSLHDVLFHLFFGNFEHLLLQELLCFMTAIHYNCGLFLLWKLTLHRNANNVTPVLEGSSCPDCNSSLLSSKVSSVGSVLRSSSRFRCSIQELKRWTICNEEYLRCKQCVFVGNLQNVFSKVLLQICKSIVIFFEPWKRYIASFSVLLDEQKHLCPLKSVNRCNCGRNTID